MPIEHEETFINIDATAMADLVRSKEVTALELTEVAIRRIERSNPKLNALASQNFEHARRSATLGNLSGPFAGVPTLLKDVLDFPEHQTAFGSRLFAGNIAKGGSAYADALNDAGLIVLGKSATSEFALLGTTESQANGPTLNPWDDSRSPGGSSGGAAAAVASGMVPIAHASDGGGSIRGPASFCGLFGFKPSQGRTLDAGMPTELPISKLISDHCVSRSVRDSAEWLRVTECNKFGQRLPPISTLKHGPRNSLRIGFCRRDVSGNFADPDGNEALDAAIELCLSLGHEVDELPPPNVNADALREAYFTLTATFLAGIIAQVREPLNLLEDDTRVEPFSWELIRYAQSLKPDAVMRSMTELRIASQAADCWVAAHDVIASPTVPFAAVTLGTFGPISPIPELFDFTVRLAGFTNLPTVAGWPAMSVPLHWNGAGLPIGCQFVAPNGCDAKLFALAFQLEAAKPWQPKLRQLAVTF